MVLELTPVEEVIVGGQLAEDMAAIGEVVTCPMGKQSISWLPNTYPQTLLLDSRVVEFEDGVY